MSMADLFLGAIVGLGVAGALLMIKGFLGLLHVHQSPLRPPTGKKLKAFVHRWEIGLIGLRTNEEDLAPVLEWAYVYKNKLHWKKHGVPITERKLDGFYYTEILPSGEVYHGEPYYNTLDAHEASEGEATRNLGTGNTSTTDIILALLGVGTLIGLIYVVYTMGQQNAGLKAQLDYVQAQLNNITAIFHG